MNFLVTGVVYENKSGGNRPNKKWMFNSCLFFVSCWFILWVETEYTVSIQNELLCVINYFVCHVQFCGWNNSQHVLVLLQCSFIPKFSISIKTKYENNNGSSENVSFLCDLIYGGQFWVISLIKKGVGK